MNIVTQISKRGIIHLPFGKKRKGPAVSIQAATLSTSELKQIVAAMLG